MGPIYFQIKIICSIWMAFAVGSILTAVISKIWPHKRSDQLLFKPRVLGLVVAAYWLIHTLSYDFLYESLRAIQLSVVVVSYAVPFFLLRSRNKERMHQETINRLLAENQKLEEQVSHLASYVSEDLDNLQTSASVAAHEVENAEIYDLEQHKKVLADSLVTAKREIIILSGWATDRAVNSEFRSMALEALDRGVNLYLGFGYESFDQRLFKKPEEKQAIKTLTEIQKISSESSSRGKLSIFIIPNHRKILICDDLFAVCGSFNWLSNNRGRNFEMSVVYRNAKDVTRVSASFKKFLGNLPPERKRLINSLFPLNPV